MQFYSITIDLITTSLEFKVDIDRFRSFDSFSKNIFSDQNEDFKTNKKSHNQSYD